MPLAPPSGYCLLTTDDIITADDLYNAAGCGIWEGIGTSPSSYRIGQVWSSRLVEFCTPKYNLVSPKGNTLDTRKYK
jgi:hypothetical protein